MSPNTVSLERSQFGVSIGLIRDILNNVISLIFSRHRKSVVLQRAKILLIESYLTRV